MTDYPPFINAVIGAVTGALAALLAYMRRDGQREAVMRQTVAQLEDHEKRMRALEKLLREDLKEMQVILAKQDESYKELKRSLEAMHRRLDMVIGRSYDDH